MLTISITGESMACLLSLLFLAVAANQCIHRPSHVPNSHRRPKSGAGVPVSTTFCRTLPFCHQGLPLISVEQFQQIDFCELHFVDDALHSRMDLAQIDSLSFQRLDQLIE